MEFLSSKPFIPSGENFELSKSLFSALGFDIEWEQKGLVSLKRGACEFILQKYVNQEFAENLMMSIGVSDLNAFGEELLEKKIAEKFPVRIGKITHQPYGMELNLIDIAGVCWHFIQ
jgi:hypothetical protein